MPEIVIVSHSPSWGIPLRESVEEFGFTARITRDLAEAIQAIPEPAVRFFVVNDDIGDENAATILRALAQHRRDSVFRIGVGEFPSPDTAEYTHAWVTEPDHIPSILGAMKACLDGHATREEAVAVPVPPVMLHELVPREIGPPQEDPELIQAGEPAMSGELEDFFDLVGGFDAIDFTSGAVPLVPREETPPSSLGSAMLEEPQTLPSIGFSMADVQMLLHRARFEPYENLLGTERGAPADEVITAANYLLDRLSAQALPSLIVQVAGGDLRELRAAIEDARELLSTPA